MTGIKILFGEAPSVRAAYTGQFVNVAAGGAHSCGIRSDGVVECTNHADSGTGGGNSFKTVSAGGDQTCAINQGAFLECSGDNTYGQAPAAWH